MLTALLAARGPLDTWSPTFIELLALFAPLVAFGLILTFTIDARRVSAWIAIVFTAAALVAAVLVLAIELAHPLHLERNSTYLTFFTNEAGAASQFKLEWGVVADGLAAVMLVVVTAISLIVQLYARESMRGNSGYVRFFVITAFLTFAMEGVVLADNYFALLFFWLLVSACSYLLIGHWWQRPAAASAARKAFMVTLIGDAGLLIGILYIYFRFNQLNFQALAPQYAGGQVSATGLFIMAGLVLLGALGKSAQFPLHVWLPDSTEGPPPTAAFLQAAGMAVAGGYLVARTFSLFQVSPRAMLAMGLVGGGTAVLAGLWALAERSLPRVIAYLTMSQMGLVFLALAARGGGAAAFQLVTHAFFTACVILVAANLVSVMRTDSLFEMGGLWRRVPLSAWTMLIGAAALVGIPPLSGFWSQTAIAARLIQNGNAVLISLAIAALFLSGLAAFRLFFLVFSGETVRRRRFEIDRIREPRSRLTTPPVILAAVAMVAGVIGIPQIRRNVVSFVNLSATGPGFSITVQAVALATLPVLAGVVVAWLIYGQRLVPAGMLARRLAPVYGPLRHAFFLDFAYRQSIGRGLLPLARAANRAERWVDYVLDRGGAMAGTLGGLRVPPARRVQRSWLGLLAGLVAMAALALVAAAGWIKVKGVIQLAALAQTPPVGSTPGEFPTLLLSSILWVPTVAAIAILFFPGRTDIEKDRIKTVAASGASLALALAVVMWYGFRGQFSQFAYDENHPWIKAVGAAYHLGVDGVSMPLVLLATLLFLVALLASWRVRERVKEYLVLLLLTQTAITGVFASLDYLLLVAFWAMALIALTLLIAGWGGSRRVPVAWRFFGFTMGAWALLVLAVVIMHFKATAPTFDIGTLHDQTFRGTIGGLLLWLTVAAFGITLAAVPLHGWLLDTVSEAGTPVAILVAGLVVKLGAYGLVRVSLGQFPEALHHVSTAIMVIGLVSVLWGGLSALGQDNAKRLVAALTVSQMGLAVLAVSSGRQVALDGALLLLFAHGLIVALLLGVVGLVAERAGTASLAGLGGLAARMPRGAVLGVVGTLAALGVPGFVGFTSQLMLLMGTYPSHRTGTMVAVLGLLLVAAALLTMVQRLFFGPLAESHARVRDAGTLEVGYASGLVFLLVLLGLLPALLIDNINSGVLSLLIRGGA